MKIEKLEIKDYKQFKDLTLDLTYPKGHQKAGEPLDKICIIGQSGTGKTNLLEIIRDKLYTNNVKADYVKDDNSDSEKIYFSGVNKVDKQDIFKLEREIFKLAKEKYELELEKYELENIIEMLKYEDLPQNLRNAKNDRENLQIEIIDKVKEIRDIFNEEHLLLKPIDIKYQNLDETAWFLLKEKIENNSIEEKQFDSKLFNKIMIDSSYTEQAKLDKEKWKNENENILENISNKLNEILIRFNLELTKIDKNQKSYNDLIFKDLSNGNIIKYDTLSTGTKNIIATFIPLKIHNPKDSIILIDEPENSFYPDIQRMLTDLYMEIGENNQLIFATHSPLIASSFEPWEVVELKFDENNQVYRELYFEGDRHVDNYMLDPRLLTWTGILTKIFDLKEKSNFSVRENKLMEYATLKAQIKTVANREEKIEKVKELKKLSKLLGLENNETNI